MFKRKSTFELRPYLGLQCNELLLGGDEVPKDRHSASKDKGKEETEA
jgi:hypothetical protein